MTKRCISIAALLAATLLIPAGQAQNRTKFAGNFNAVDFAYGVMNFPAPLVVYQGTTATGAQTITLNTSCIALGDGTTLCPFGGTTVPPITIGSAAGSNLETVTPSSVSNCSYPVTYGCTVTATFAYTHGAGDLIYSGSFGLQEALNACGAYGGGTVTVDAKWSQAGGVAATILAATVPSTCALIDNRVGGGGSPGTFIATYSFAVDGGAVGLITPSKTVTLPKNFVITNAIINSPTPVSSGGSATISVGLSAGSSGAAALLAATGKASFSANAQQQGVPTAGTLSSAIKMSAAGSVTLTVAVAALTAGVVDVVIQGYQSPN